MRSLTWWSSVCAVVSLALGGASLGAAIAADTQQQAASRVGSDYDGHLYAVDAYSPTEAWAVGFAGPSMLALHWDGETWAKTTVPVPKGAIRPALDGVAVIAPDDVWAVGAFYFEAPSEAGRSTTVVLRPLIEHWDGAEWTIVRGARLGGGSGSILNGVSGTGPDDVWAVGDHYSDDVRRPLIEHWDGVEWTQVEPSGPPGFSRGSLTSVSAVTPTDAWVAGVARRNGYNHTAVARWDGERWSRTPVPGKPGEHAGLEAISAAGSAVFAVGTHDVSTPLLIHWDGLAWINDPLPPRPDKKFDIVGVSATSASDAWAVGSRFGSKWRLITWHWDGVAWNYVPSPEVTDAKQNQFYAVSATDEDDAWAVGDYTRDKQRHVLIERWNGITWEQWATE